MTITGDELTIAGILAAAVIALWRMHVATAKKTEIKLEKCEEGHKESNDHIIKLTERVGYVEGRQDGVESLSRQVLDTVHQAVIDGSSGISQSDLNSGDNPSVPPSRRSVGQKSPAQA